MHGLKMFVLGAIVNTYAIKQDIWRYLFSKQHTTSFTIKRQLFQLCLHPFGEIKDPGGIVPYASVPGVTKHLKRMKCLSPTQYQLEAKILSPLEITSLKIFMVEEYIVP